MRMLRRRNLPDRKKIPRRPVAKMQAVRKKPAVRTPAVRKRLQLMMPGLRMTKIRRRELPLPVTRRQHLSPMRMKLLIHRMPLMLTMGRNTIPIQIPTHSMVSISPQKKMEPDTGTSTITILTSGSGSAILRNSVTRKPRHRRMQPLPECGARSPAF